MLVIYIKCNYELCSLASRCAQCIVCLCCKQGARFDAMKGQKIVGAEEWD